MKYSGVLLITNNMLSNLFFNLFELFFPDYCINCKESIQNKRKYLCLSCLADLPLTHFSFQGGNDIEISFKGRIPVCAATSLLYFEQKGLVQKLIHELKYRNKPQIGNFLGQWLGEEMILSKRFEQIDYVVPVPLHPAKEKERGYNQVDCFAASLAKVLKSELKLDLLRKVSNSSTRSLLDRQQRTMGSTSEFVLNKLSLVENKHILLVDDVITSGATMKACADSLGAASSLKISLASMAFTP